MAQKFKKGDLVRVAKDLKPTMGHFTADCDAIVIEHSDGDYGLFLKDKGECWWYEEEQLTLIEKGRSDLLKKWKAEEKAEEKEKSNIDWIFSHGKEVLAKSHGASVATLAKCFGLTDLWGSHGEGFIYYQNAMVTLRLAAPFLETGDKAGWLARCKEIRLGCQRPGHNQPGR